MMGEGPPRRRVAATPRPRRGYSVETSRGDAAVATWIFRGSSETVRAATHLEETTTAFADFCGVGPLAPSSRRTEQSQDRRARSPLGREVPARRDVVRHGLDAARRLLVEVHARQPKVANLQVAVRVDEQIPRLQVAVRHRRRRRVQKFHAPQHLVDEELDVVVGEGLGRFDHGAQIRLHQIRDDALLLHAFL